MYKFLNKFVLNINVLFFRDSFSADLLQLIHVSKSRFLQQIFSEDLNMGSETRKRLVFFWLLNPRIFLNYSKRDNGGPNYFSEVFLKILEHHLFRFSTKNLHGHELQQGTDVHRRFGTLVIDMLLLENPQFLPNNYETLPK